MKSVEQPRRAEANRLVTVESCHSIWLFDEEERRLRRILRGFRRASPIATEWRHYARLLMDDVSGAFLIFLNEAGTRAICSFRHTDDCARCAQSVTTEISLAELRALTGP